MSAVYYAAEYPQGVAAGERYPLPFDSARTRDEYVQSAPFEAAAVRVVLEWRDLTAAERRAIRDIPPYSESEVYQSQVDVSAAYRERVEAEALLPALCLVCRGVAEDHGPSLGHPFVDTDLTLIRAAVEASGLSARRFAERVISRDERTVRLWTAGTNPIPPLARAWLVRWLALPARVRRQIVSALAPAT